MKKILTVLIFVLCAGALFLILSHESRQECFFREIPSEILDFPERLYELTSVQSNVRQENSDPALRITAFYQTIDSALIAYSSKIGSGIPVPFNKNGYEITEVMFTGCTLNYNGNDIISHFQLKIKPAENYEPPVIRADLIDETGRLIQSGYFYQSYEDSAYNNIRCYKYSAGGFDKLKKLKRIIFKRTEVA